MLKKIMLLSLSFITINNFAMQPQLAPWVQAAREIKVRTLAKYLMNVQIDDNSTVADIKTRLHDMEGIPAGQQSLFPSFTNWWTLGTSDKRGPRLDNNENIKEVMHRYNSDRFLVCLSLPNPIKG